MLKTIQYVNWSTQVFDGFYESLLWDSDAIFNLCDCEPEPPVGYYYDIYGFESYMEEVEKEAVFLMDCELAGEDSIIKSMKFTGISSPRYYNFSTDKLCIDVEVDYSALRSYCLIENRDEFDEYLKENFTSYDGFISFVDNNVHDFELNLDSESDKYDDVMLEFYILNQDYMKEREYDFSEYKSELYEKANEMKWNRLCLRRESDDKCFEYTLSPDESTVIVREEIKE